MHDQWSAPTSAFVASRYYLVTSVTNEGHTHYEPFQWDSSNKVFSITAEMVPQIGETFVEPPDDVTSMVSRAGGSSGRDASISTLGQSTVVSDKSIYPYGTIDSSYAHDVGQ